ncbi:NEDD8-conjugating enzyme ube2f [Cichlidogyrus casuarinus]|uniref:E2 NEDD8-conjugating enzyme n=1 Tax=Cichlidogyrus casuarinus TaxID=1844966 RepID=A0ABD2PLT8_9PLAT
MLNLAEKLKRQQSGTEETKSDVAESYSLAHARVRDQLLLREIQELSSTILSTCKTRHPDPSKLHEFELIIKPDSGMWSCGQFLFKIVVPENYNFYPPKVTCMTKIWHPNIDEQGNVCLSILRENSLDSSGWLPTRTLKDVVWGLDSLFTDLCDFKDALNTEAADQYMKDSDGFRRKVNDYIHKFC